MRPEDTYKPILDVRARLRSGLLRPSVYPKPGLAVVVHRRGRPLDVLKPPERPSSKPTEEGGSGDPDSSTATADNKKRLTRFRLIRHLYLVDVSDHQMEIRTDLPAEGSAFHFKTIVNFTCAVRDPATIVARGINDVESILRPLLVDAMRHVSRQYRVENSAEAERKITEQLCAKQDSDDPFDKALALANFVVRLDLDATTLDHLRERK